jgi:hypothetical protein
MSKVYFKSINVLLSAYSIPNQQVLSMQKYRISLGLRANLTEQAPGADVADIRVCCKFKSKCLEASITNIRVPIGAKASIE